MLVLLPAMLFAGQKNKTKKANAETAAWRYEIQIRRVSTWPASRRSRMPFTA